MKPITDTDFMAPLHPLYAPEYWHSVEDFHRTGGDVRALRQAAVDAGDSRMVAIIDRSGWDRACLPVTTADYLGGFQDGRLGWNGNPLYARDVSEYVRGHNAGINLRNAVHRNWEDRNREIILRELDNQGGMA